LLSPPLLLLLVFSDVAPQVSDFLLAVETVLCAALEGFEAFELVLVLFGDFADFGVLLVDELLLLGELGGGLGLGLGEDGCCCWKPCVRMVGMGISDWCNVLAKISSLI